MSYRPRVSYFYDSEVGNYHYGQGHPMKPHRVRMAHHLIVNYNLYREMDIFMFLTTIVQRPPLVNKEELTRFHSDDYINFLYTISPDNMHEHVVQLQKFNVGEDCPVFDGLFEFCQISASGSIGSAARLNNLDADICINWAGGLHHAKKSEASGFCYVNDCVLGILELLKTHERVLYIDIDIHHGDGVEEAFYNSNRVMCLSLHKYGEYFPGTGSLIDVGVDKGRNYSVNVPLRDGMNDESYRSVFRPIVAKIMERFQPGAVVLQCGADSLSGDRLGCFNLSHKGHGDCVEYMRTFGVPLLVCGGGGYTMRNVARTWCYETSVCIGMEIPDELPFNEYFEYFGPDYRLSVQPSNMENLNDTKYLEFLKERIFEQLSQIEAAPGSQILTGQGGGSEVPKGYLEDKSALEDSKHPDSRTRDDDVDRRRHRAEFYDGEKDNDAE